MHLAICKVAITLRRDVARPNRFPLRSRSVVSEMIAKCSLRHGENSRCVLRSGIVTTERDGYFLFPPANAVCTPTKVSKPTRVDTRNELESIVREAARFSLSNLVGCHWRGCRCVETLLLPRGCIADLRRSRDSILTRGADRIPGLPTLRLERLGPGGKAACRGSAEACRSIR